MQLTSGNKTIASLHPSHTWQQNQVSSSHLVTKSQPQSTPSSHLATKSQPQSTSSSHLATKSVTVKGPAHTCRPGNKITVKCPAYISGNKTTSACPLSSSSLATKSVTADAQLKPGTKITLSPYPAQTWQLNQRTRPHTAHTTIQNHGHRVNVHLTVTPGSKLVATDLFTSRIRLE